jgi:hypothetical protein
MNEWMNEWMNSPKMWQIAPETSCVCFMQFGLSAVWQHNFTFLRSWQVLSQSWYSPHCMQPESSLLHSQAPIIHFCPELDQSSPYRPSNFLKIIFLVLFYYLCLGLANGLFLSGLTTKTMYTCILLSPICALLFFRFDNLNNIWKGIQIIKLLLM